MNKVTIFILSSTLPFWQERCSLLIQRHSTATECVVYYWNLFIHGKQFNISATHLCQNIWSLKTLFAWILTQQRWGPPRNIYMKLKPPIRNLVGSILKTSNRSCWFPWLSKQLATSYANLVGVEFRIANHLYTTADGSKYHVPINSMWDLRNIFVDRQNVRVASSNSY